MFDQNKPEPDYQASEYATGNWRWKQTPSVHPVEITQLLNYKVQNKHNKKNLGRQSGASAPTKYKSVGQNFGSLSDTFGQTQKGPRYGSGYQDGGHLHVRQAQQRW